MAAPLRQGRSRHRERTPAHCGSGDKPFVLLLGQIPPPDPGPEPLNQHHEWVISCGFLAKSRVDWFGILAGLRDTTVREAPSDRLTSGRLLAQTSKTVKERSEPDNESLPDAPSKSGLQGAGYCSCGPVRRCLQQLGRHECREGWHCGGSFLNDCVPHDDGYAVDRDRVVHHDDSRNDDRALCDRYDNNVLASG